VTDQKRAWITCACCGRHEEHRGRRLCKSCYERHYKAKTLDRFPCRPLAEPWVPVGRWGLAILARYEELLAEGASVRTICWELSLTERSVQRYEAARKHLAQRDAVQAVA
jgi:hypothetical protein